MISQAEELATRRFELKQRQKQVTALIWKCCVNCAFFKKLHEGQYEMPYMTCTKWNAIPPPATVVVGCEEYLDDIPF